MKYFTFTIVTIVAAMACADTPDLTGSLEFIANPQMERWPNNALARACLDLQFYQGRLFNGGGEVETNPGAPWISSLDPYDNSIRFEFAPGTEAIANYRVTSWGDLVTPSQDPHEGDANLGHVFSRNPEGTWTVFKSVGGSIAAGTGKTVANNTHCWDMEEFDGRIFVSCYNLQSSTDHCKTFTACSPIDNAYHSIGYCYAYTRKFLKYQYQYDTISTLRRQMHLLRFGDSELFAIGNTVVQPQYIDNSKIDSSKVNCQEYYRYDKTTHAFTVGSQPVSDIYPGLSTNDYRLVGRNLTYLATNQFAKVWARIWHTTPFKNRVLYVGCYDTPPYGSVSKPYEDSIALTSYPLPLMGCSATVTSGKIKATRISFGNDKENYPWDFAVVGDTVYALTSRYVADGKKNHHIVWKSTDGVNFTEVFSFDFHQNFISLEYRDGWFYLGVGYKAATKGYTYDKTGDESGAIYRVWCPQEPVRVVPSVNTLELAEGASATVTFRLSAQPPSNLVLRVGAALKNTRFTTDKSELSFTTSDWNAPKSVTISVDDNDILDLNRSGAVVCGSAGFDVVRGEFCGSEVTAGVINIILGDSEFAPPANGEIYTADDFYCAMAFPNGDYKMMKDIDLTDSLFTTVPEFSGTLDGCGHTISGLGDGPLATLNRGVIRNLTLDGTVSGKATEVKGIARGIFFDKMSGGAFTNCVLKGYTLKAGAPDTILGLYVAEVNGPCEFAGCSTAADCTLSQAGSHDCSIGGMVGKIEVLGAEGVVAAFIDCTNNAAIAASDNYRAASGAGGFVGYVTGSASVNQSEVRFIRSVNNGTITGKDRYSVLGGFAGRFNASNSNKSSTLAYFADCINNASISHTGNGKSSGAAGGFAGIIGNAANAVFDRCVNRGDVTGPSQLSAGGLVGEFGNPSPVGANGVRIVNSANYGNIAATNNVGGLIGKSTGSTGTGWKNGHWRFLNSANYGSLAKTAVTVNGELSASVSCEATAATASITVSNCWTVTDRLFATTSRQAACGGNYTAATDAATAAAALDAAAAKDESYLSWAVGPTGHPELVAEEPTIPVEPPAMTYQFYHEALNIPAMHAKGITGRGVRVGVVDDGIYPVVIGGVTNLGFAALAGSVHAGYHGTSVASLIGSKEFGLAPDCEIWAYNSGDSAGQTGLDRTLAGLWWCATNGCRVINMSFGFAPDMYTAAQRTAFDAELAEIQRQTGVILINGNGNNALNDINYFPQDSECVITIGGLKPDKTPAALTDSWRKDFCTFGDQVPDFVRPDGTIGMFDGTSCACPLATALVALLLQQEPTLTQDEVYGIFKNSVEVLAPGRTREYGWGLLQACEVPADYKRQSEYDAEKSEWVKLQSVTITNKYITYTPADNFYEITMRTGSVIRLMLSSPVPANATDTNVYWYCGNNHAGKTILLDQILRAPDEIATVTEITIGGQTIKLPTPNLENVYSYQGLNANYELLFNLRVRLTTDPVEIPENEDPNYVPADPERPERTDWSYYHESLNVPALHAKGITGRGVRVGVVDGPINEVTVDGEKNLTIARLAGSGHGNGHGLSVASIIASKKFGIAPDCELYAYDVGNSTAADQVNKVLKGLWWCATNGCRVINMSFSFNPFQPDVKDLRESFDTEIKKICDQTGVILIASLGNIGLNDNPYFPQDTAYPICIGGITQDKQPTDLTKSWRHDFCAYGKQVPTFTKADGTIGNQDGTSFSAPMATGVAALLLQQVPTLTRDELYGILKGSAEVLAEGRTREYGWGLVRACEVPADYKRQSEYDAEKSVKVRLAGITINNQNVFYNPEVGFFDMTVKVGKVVKIDYTPSPANATDKRAYWYTGNTQKLEPILADDVLRVRDDASLVGGFATYTARNDDYEELLKLRVFFTDQDIGSEPEDPEEPVDPPSGDQSVVYVAVTGSDSASGAFDAPFLTISNAVARLGSAGGMVRVMPGLYPQCDPVVLTSAVEVVGHTGNPADVIVSNAYGSAGSNWDWDKTHVNRTSHNLFQLKHADSLVAGVTMAKGSYYQSSEQGGSFTIDAAGGTVSNCVITSGNANNYHTPSGGGYVKGGLVTHCVFEKCTCDTHGGGGKGGAIKLNGDGARVSNCLIRNVSPNNAAVIYVTKGTVENCTVVGGQMSDMQYDGAVCCASAAVIKNVVIAGVMATNGTVRAFSGAGSVTACADDSGTPFNQSCYAITTAAFADYANGDYRPVAGGALVDAGAAIADAPAGDLDGYPRVVGTAIDIGCFEWQAPSQPKGVLIIYR